MTTRHWWLIAVTRRMTREDARDAIALLAVLAGLYAGWWVA